MQKQIDSNDSVKTLASLFSWLRSTILPSEESSSKIFVDDLSKQDLKSWIVSVSEYHADGRRCAAILNDKKKTITVLLVDERGDAIYDENGRRVACQFSFSVLQPDCRSLFGEDSAIVIEI